MQPITQYSISNEIVILINFQYRKNITPNQVSAKKLIFFVRLGT